MQRLTELEPILFPVGLTDIYHHMPHHAQQAALFEGQPAEPMERIPGFQAITNLQTGHVYSVVTKGYRLVTNQEAIDLARQCFQQLFGVESTHPMEVFNITTSQSRSYCHIDFIHRDYAINLGRRETWLPYLRATNSYNRTRALSFDLGFCRTICSNGMIFERETIRYKFLHTNRNISPVGQFQVDFEKFQFMQADFEKSVKRWMGFSIPASAFFSLVCQALQLKFDLQADDPARQVKERARLESARQEIAPLVKQYVDELGENAYAVLGVITEIASRPPSCIAPAWMMDTLQRRAGSWFREFSHTIQQPGFELNGYLMRMNDYINLQ